MMESTRFSIITICYNAEAEIEDTLNSVYNQQYRNYEYIVIDGKSSDNTMSIVKKFRGLFDNIGIRMRYISEKDEGISDAFNKGIKLAEGDYIGLINAGDMLMPNSLATIDSFLEESDEIIYGKTLFIDKKRNLKYLRPIPKDLDLSLMKYNGLVFTHQSAFVKREVYEKYGLYDLSYKLVMDWDLFLLFNNNGVKFRYCDAVLVAMLADGISTRGTYSMLQEKIRISKKYDGNPTYIIFLNWLIRDNLLRIIKNIVKTICPWAWYKLIGKDRVMNTT